MNTREVINKQLELIDDEEFELSLIVDIFNKKNKKFSDMAKKWNEDNKNTFEYNLNDQVENMENFLEQQLINPYTKIRTEFVNVTFNSLDFNNDKMNKDSETILSLSLKKMFDNDETNKDYLKLKSSFISSTPKETLDVVDYLLDGCDFV